MKIRKLTPHDWEKLRNIRLTALETDPQAFGGNLEEEKNRIEPDWRKRLESKERIYFVVEDGDIFVSLAGAMVSQEGEWLLVAVYTLPMERGKGHARSLVEGVLGELKERGEKSVKLTVNADQIDAVRVYEKAGFDIVGEQEEMMGDGKLHREYLMRKIF